MNDKVFVENDIKAVLGDIPNVKDSRDRVMDGGNPTPSPRIRKEAYSELQEILDANIKNTGFFTFFILNYLPEIPYIGYAYALAIGYPTAKLDRLFDSTVCESICSLFGKISDDNIFDYNITSLVQNHIETETSMFEICMLAIATYAQKGDTFTIFDHAYDEIHSFLVAWGNRAAGWKGIITENDHGTALEMYQVLYEAEISLTLLNKRSKVSPIEYAKTKFVLADTVSKSVAMSTASPRSKSMAMSTPSPRSKSMAMSTPSPRSKSKTKSKSKSRKTTKHTKARKRLIHSKPKYNQYMTHKKRRTLTARE
jgi:hypothetical protein